MATSPTVDPQVSLVARVWLAQMVVTQLRLLDSTGGAITSKGDAGAKSEIDCQPRR
jgi:hypothetical protein